MSDLEGYWPGQVLESVTLVQAPEAYPNTLPEDLTGTIADISTFYHNNLIAGDYLYILENSCGVSYELEVTINPSSTNLQMITSTRADCELGKGGIRISGNQSSIVSITMTGAPPEFEQQLPLDVSNYLTVTGVFSITNLPPGLYSFDILDSCGVQHLLTDKAVVAYVVDESEITITKHCNSFEASINHASQNTVSQSFWLQRYNEIDMVWEHPLTGADHTEGNAPTLVTAVPLSNFQNNINLDYLGSFRIIKSFTAFDNGFVGPNPYKTCIEVLETFEHDGNVHIVDVVKLTCDGALSSVKVIADGVAPFTYSITEKNGEPFLVDNGTNDTFTNLEPAIYKFVVGQFCGGTDPYVVDISSLPSLVDAFPPQPQLFSCENPADDGAGTFDLSVQNSFILGTQDAALYNISYHQSQADADAGLNPLPSLHTTVPATIYGRIEVTGGTCYRTVSFDLVVQPLPELGFSTQVGLCPGEGKTLTATPGYDSYLWSTGETGNAVFVDEPGELTLTVTRNYPSGPCSATFVINVQPQPVAEINEIVTSDWTDRANTITVLLNNPENSGFEFSIDGINWQQSNTFDGLSPGAYTVQVRDTAGCGETSATVNLLMYPLFFTPNGDGYNDSWKIKLAELEPGLQTFIYDRYGKFLKQLGYNSQGWDGTHAGKMLPSTDYWFLVKRADGREFRGHFTMKR
ncbi:MAG: T9SS type B sorting domain-containing protein [Chitinophagaceae bacterium]|nr:MAG: T9SS type B sorting domain-containing protein [Chitinophagaceae bacterium]